MTNFLATHEFKAGALALMHGSKLVFPAIKSSGVSLKKPAEKSYINYIQQVLLGKLCVRCGACSFISVR